MKKSLGAAYAKERKRTAHKALIFMALGLLLGLTQFYCKAVDILDYPYRDLLGLTGLVFLLGSGWVVLKSVYGIPRIVWMFNSASCLIFLSLAMNLVENYTHFGLPDDLFGIVTQSVPALVGLALLFGTFYMCIFETDKAKMLLGEEAEKLAQQVAEREKAERDLRRSEENFRILAETSTAATVIHYGDKFVYANAAAKAITGYEGDSLLDMKFWEFIHPDLQEVVRERGLARLSEQTPPSRYELSLRTKDGQFRWIDLSLGTIQFDEKKAVLCNFLDITERKEAEETRQALEVQVQRTQKLESLGVLAGGIAHDFNNLLMGILGNADLALLDLPLDSPVRENLKGIENASRRAADLARQMLAYSGKGRFIVEPLDLGTVLVEITNLITASISKKARLNYNMAKDLPAIEADATQMRQVFMNLLTNASEALGDQNGTISVCTGAMHCDRSYLCGTYLDEQLPEGLYVYCEVSDSGCGMDAETRTRIFDPFFTTKFTGRGLGLAAVLGIVRGHRGAIRVYSEPGRGTTFKVLFPAADRAASAAAEQPSLELEWKGKGTILLVDDEESVRIVGRQMLEKAGFEVVTAVDGRDALVQFQACTEPICCVLLDLTMPRMDGEETFRELHNLCNDVRVVLSSGYNEQEAVNRFTQSGLAGFIQKPYQYINLVSKLRQVLSTGQTA